MFEFEKVQYLIVSQNQKWFTESLVFKRSKIFYQQIRSKRLKRRIKRDLIMLADKVLHKSNYFQNRQKGVDKRGGEHSVH